MGLLKPWRNVSFEETSLATGKTSCFLVRTTEQKSFSSYGPLSKGWGKLYSGVLQGQSADRSKGQHVVEVGIGLVDGAVLRSPPPLELQSQTIAFQPSLTENITWNIAPQESWRQQVPQWLLAGFPCFCSEYLNSQHFLLRYLALPLP